MLEDKRQVLCAAYHGAVLCLVEIHCPIRDRLRNALGVLENTPMLLSAAPAHGDVIEEVQQLKLATFLNAKGKLETMNVKELSDLALSIWIVDCELKKIDQRRFGEASTENRF